MKRRGFLKLLAGGTALAYVAGTTPIPLFGNTDLYIRHMVYNDVEHDTTYHRLDWYNGKKQYGVDFKAAEELTPEDIEQKMEPALRVLLDHVKHHEGSIYKSIPLKAPNSQVKIEGFKVPAHIEAKYT